MAQLLVIVLSVFAFSGQVSAQEYVPGEVIVRLKGDSGSSESYAFLGKAHFSKAMSMKESWTQMNMYHFSLSKGQSVEAAVQELKADPNVLYAEPNYIFHKSSDTGMHNSFSAEEIQAASVQSQAVYMATGAPLGVQSVWTSSSMPAVKPIVAVIDTGIDYAHKELVESVWVNPGESGKWEPPAAFKTKITCRDRGCIRA